MTTTPAELRTRWTAFRNPAEDDEGLSLDDFSAESFVVMYSDRGGDSGDEVMLRLALAFESAADFAAFLRCSELPRCVAWDSGSRDVDHVSDFDEYLADFPADRQSAVRECAAKLEAVIDGQGNADEAILLFNETCKKTNPSLQAIAWGTVADVLKSPAFAADFAEIISYEPEGEVADMLALLESDEFDSANEDHLDLALFTLEELEEF